MYERCAKSIKILDAKFAQLFLNVDILYYHGRVQDF